MNHFDSWWWSSHLEVLNKCNNQWDFWTDSVQSEQTAVMDPVLKSPDLLQQTAGQTQWHHWRTRELLSCLKDRRWRSVCVWSLCLWSLVEKRQTAELHPLTGHKRAAAALWLWQKTGWEGGQVSCSGSAAGQHGNMWEDGTKDRTLRVWSCRELHFSAASGGTSTMREVTGVINNINDGCTSVEHHSR